MKRERVPNKDVTKLIRKFKPGYRIARTKTGHPRVIAPDGSAVRDAQGRPVTLPATPSGLALSMYERKLRKAGVLE